MSTLTVYCEGRDAATRHRAGGKHERVVVLTMRVDGDASWFSPPEALQRRMDAPKGRPNPGGRERLSIACDCGESLVLDWNPANWRVMGELARAGVTLPLARLNASVSRRST